MRLTRRSKTVLGISREEDNVNAWKLLCYLSPPSFWLEDKGVSCGQCPGLVFRYKVHTPEREVLLQGADRSPLGYCNLLDSHLESSIHQVPLPLYQSIDTMTTNLVSVLIVALSVYAVVKLYYTKIRGYYRLRHIPGPWFSGWSRLFIISATARNTLHLDLARACQKWGPLVRIDPNTLLTNDPDLIRRMNAVRSPYRKGEVGSFPVPD
jgi:hypothetical protein